MSPPPLTAPILLLGASGTLGRAIVRICLRRSLRIVALHRADLDLTDPARVAAALAAHRPWAVINAVGYVRVQAAELDEATCLRDNLQIAATLAQACAVHAIPFITFSSDLVFPGNADRAYVESDATGPQSVYGRSKELAEAAVLAAHPHALVIRSSAFFGPWDPHNFVHHAVHRVAGGGLVQAPNDVAVAPTYVPDLVDAALDLLIDGEHGRWHLVSSGAVSWAELAERAVQLAGGDRRRIASLPANALPWALRWPRNSLLSSERGMLLPPLDDALERWVRDREVVPAASLHVAALIHAR